MTSQQNQHDMLNGRGVQAAHNGNVAIYGVGLRGATEIRYVGQTIRPLSVRLTWALFAAKRMPRPTNYARWLIDNEPGLDIFAIDTAESLVEALETERGAIKFCLALGHRLFNIHHVPRAKRIAPREPEAIAA